MIKKLLALFSSRAQLVSDSSAIKNGYNIGRYDAGSNPKSQYYKS